MGQILAFHTTFFCFPNVVWASASGNFRIISDTLVIISYIACKCCSHINVFVFGLAVTFVTLVALILF